MELTHSEMHELAVFFAKRVTLGLQPLDPMDPPPPGDPVRRWLERLANAQRNQSLPILARRVADAVPDDSSLQTACRLLEGERDGEALMAALILAGGAAATLGAVSVAGAVLALATLATAATAATTSLEGEPEQAVVTQELMTLQPQSLAPSEIEDNPTWVVRQCEQASMSSDQELAPQDSSWMPVVSDAPEAASGPPG